jgi:predicted DNA-binding protein
VTRTARHGKAMTQHGLRLPEEYWQKLCKMAARLSRRGPGTVTASDLVREAVRQYIRKDRSTRGEGP